jgi:hypothetical protein
MLFSIQPLTITVSANQLFVDVVGTFQATAKIYYRLIKPDGSSAEEGNKEIPLEALALLAQNPMNIEQLNQLLSQWNITAIEKIN